MCDIRLLFVLLEYSIKLRDDFLKINNCENVNSIQDKIHNIEPKKAIHYTHRERERERERVCGRYACVCVSQRVSLRCSVAKTPTEKFLRAQTCT
uniref:Uncharacterized protein n=1 Tax=Trichogramma kaykai TaxID=54128 RepID=A0ABD2X2R4_9HYME